MLATGAHSGSFEIETVPVLNGSAPTVPVLQGQVETLELDTVGADKIPLIFTLDSPLLGGNAAIEPALEGIADPTKLEGIGAAVALEGVKKPTPILIKIPDPTPMPAPKPEVETTIVLRDPDEYDVIGIIAAKNYRKWHYTHEPSRAHR